jgi:hypothetical protein
VTSEGYATCDYCEKPMTPGTTCAPCALINAQQIPTTTNKQRKTAGQTAYAQVTALAEWGSTPLLRTRK